MWPASSRLLWYSRLKSSAVTWLAFIAFSTTSSRVTRCSASQTRLYQPSLHRQLVSKTVKERGQSTVKTSEVRGQGSELKVKNHPRSVWCTDIRHTFALFSRLIPNIIIITLRAELTRNLHGCRPGIETIFLRPRRNEFASDLFYSDITNISITRDAGVRVGFCRRSVVETIRILQCLSRRVDAWNRHTPTQVTLNRQKVFI